MDTINELFSNANLIPSSIMVMITLYWLLMIFGVVGMDILEFDADVDVDLGIDADLDADIDFDAGDGALSSGSATTGSETAFRSIFEFFYLSDVPIVIVASVFMFCFWMTLFVFNHFLNDQQTFLTSLIWAVPSFVVALLATRVVIWPVAKMFQVIPEDNSNQQMMGRVGRVSSRRITDQYGQIEVSLPNEPELLLNAVTEPGQVLRQGDAAKIISYNQKDGTFVVALTKWENTNDEQ